jgi:2-polyprenyl-3-methyl-5-hydroxy-6-metoxy-1,4-benzoquinol methylase
MENFRNKMMVIFDSELSEMKKVINEALPDRSSDCRIDECDEIFLNRMRSNPTALKMSFWENHFEWQAVKDYPEMHGRILDFGCGSGHSDIILARNNYTIHGIDLSRVGINIAKYLRDKEVPAVRQNLSFSVADIIIDIPERTFDSAWSSHVFEHIAEPAPVLKGLKHWLNPGAYMLISVPYGYAYDDPGHVNHFANGEELVKFLGDTVKVQRIDISEEHQVIRALCRF